MAWRAFLASLMDYPGLAPPPGLSDGLACLFRLVPGHPLARACVRVTRIRARARVLLYSMIAFWLLFAPAKATKCYILAPAPACAGYFSLITPGKSRLFWLLARFSPIAAPLDRGAAQQWGYKIDLLFSPRAWLFHLFPADPRRF